MTANHSPLYRAILLFLVPVSLPVFANSADLVLEPLVVTATKNPTKTTNLIAQTQVIDKDILRTYAGQNAFDVIKNQTGFSHYSSGGSDKASNIYLRGYDGKAILVIIDGVRYSNLTTSTAALGQLSANNIERIEILHGATGAAIYGADAMGGVIQIFSKKGGNDGNAALTFGVGSHNALDYGTSIGYSNDNTRLNLSAYHEKSDGINAIKSPVTPSQQDKDGYDRKSISVHLSQKFGALEVGANAVGSKSTSDYDNTYATTANIYNKNKNGAASAYLNMNYGQGNAIKLQYGKSIDKTTNFTDDKATSSFDSTQTQSNLSINHKLGDGNVIAGAEYLEQKLESSVAFSQKQRSNKALFAGYQASYDNLDAQIFVRYDNNSWYKSKTTYNAGLGYRLNPNIRLGASYATSYRAPNFGELFYPSNWGGNPDLVPETSKNSEVFVELSSNNKISHKTRLTGYLNHADNLIVSAPPAYKFHNIQNAKIIGANLVSDWRLGNYSLGLSYDYQEANSIKDNQKSSLPIRPIHKGLAYIGYHHDKFSLRGEYRRIGSYYFSPNHANKVDSYGLVNVMGTYHLNDNVRVEGRINNLLNKDYVTNASQGRYGTVYNEDGMNFKTSVTFSY